MNPLMATAERIERIERILRNELDRTHPDGVARIRRAADKHSHALDAYKTALRRFQRLRDQQNGSR